MNGGGTGRGKKYEAKKNNKNCLDDYVGFNYSFHGYLDDRAGPNVVFKIWKRFGG
jgi:hypothetical protein